MVENVSQVEVEMLFSVTHVSARAIPKAKDTPRVSALRIGIEGVKGGVRESLFKVTASVYIKV